jgi:hypothetical protein
MPECLFCCFAHLILYIVKCQINIFGIKSFRVMSSHENIFDLGGGLAGER